MAGPSWSWSASPQPWREVRYWLHDLATEISAAEKDGTLPELALDRIWITGEGRAKLLDFPAPGPAGKSEVRNPKAESEPGSPPQTAQGFLAEVAAAALEGTGAASAKAAGDVALPLPLHARTFLKSLSQMAGADAVAAALKPLLSRVAAVSRLRRAALVAGCIVFPLMACVRWRLWPDLPARPYPEESGPDGTEHPAANANLGAVLGRQERAVARRPPVRHLHRPPLLAASLPMRPPGRARWCWR